MAYMKQVFIPVKADIDLLPVVKKYLTKLPKKIGLVTTVQFLYNIKEVETFLKKEGFHVEFGGQILGCKSPVFKDIDAVLFIGDGKFHPKGVYMRDKFQIILLDPFDESMSILTSKDMEELEKKKKGAYIKFLSSNKVGVIISLKWGQEFMEPALRLEKKYPDKEFYYIAFETIDFGELENFPFIECFVNTACPRIGYYDTNKFRKPVVNLTDVL